MTRGLRQGLLLLALVLVLFPLALAKPGLPVGMKADESAYYLMAQSIARDFDLRLDEGDVERAFREFPYRPISNLIVMTTDGWRTMLFGKPFVYPLFAAPFARAFGANGLVAFNHLLFVAMLAGATAWLARRQTPGEEWRAGLFAAAFLLLSVAYDYAFWMQPEVFNMAAITAALGLAWPRPERPGGAAAVPRSAAALALSGAVLALAVYNKPVFAAFALPILLAHRQRERWRLAASWVAGLVASLAALAGVAVLWTGQPTSYLGVERQGVTLCEPGRLPQLAGTATGSAAPGSAVPASPPPAAAAAASPTRNAWSWIFRPPETSWAEFREDLLHFWLGRHTGLVLYLPLALVALVFFLLDREARGDPMRWGVLLAAAAIGLFFLVFVHFNWHGGGGFLGNRYFVSAYPALIFLVGRIRPLPVLGAGVAWAALTVVPIHFAAFGATGPEPTLQAHVRNAPFRHFPVELSLRNVPGYERVALGDLRVVGRRDQFLPRGDWWWLRGGDAVELWLLAPEPLPPFALALDSAAPGNSVRIDLDGRRVDLRLEGPGSPPATVRLTPAAPTRRTSQWGHAAWVHALTVTSERARQQEYYKEFPPNRCPYFPEPAGQVEGFPLGVRLTYLGAAADLDADVYAAEWLAVEAPARVGPGERFRVEARLRNASAHRWPVAGAARVRAAYSWRDAARGETVVASGERTDLAAPTEPGGEAAVSLAVQAPDAPGRYVLRLEPVFEHVAWFGDRSPASVHETVIEVAPTAAGMPPR